MARFSQGDKVVHGYLGLGNYERKINQFMSMVRFDNTPDVRYNMGENPTIVFNTELKKVKDSKP